MIATRNQIYMPDSWDDPLEAGESAGEKPRFAHADAARVAEELLVLLAARCVLGRCMVCGSLRRRKATVGDIELVFASQERLLVPERRNLFGELESPATFAAETSYLLADLVSEGVIEPRLKKDGTQTWGGWNRLAVHRASGIPVDFFRCTEASFWNTVVCRTGGKLTNTQICNAAIAKGWHWKPSPNVAGFRRARGLDWELHEVNSEREVFDFVGLPWREPSDRV